MKNVNVDITKVTFGTALAALGSVSFALLNFAYSESSGNNSEHNYADVTAFALVMTALAVAAGVTQTCGLKFFENKSISMTSKTAGILIGATFSLTGFAVVLATVLAAQLGSKDTAVEIIKFGLQLLASEGVPFSVAAIKLLKSPEDVAANSSLNSSEDGENNSLLTPPKF